MILSLLALLRGISLPHNLGSLIGMVDQHVRNIEMPAADARWADVGAAVASVMDAIADGMAQGEEVASVLRRHAEIRFTRTLSNLGLLKEV
jgi:hypothetical protein